MIKRNPLAFAAVTAPNLPDRAARGPSPANLRAAKRLAPADARWADLPDTSTRTRQRQRAEARLAAKRTRQAAAGALSKLNYSTRQAIARAGTEAAEGENHDG